MAFKMKGNPYKMGKMATKSSMKMKKEAMAKMKKESMAKLKDESAMKLKTSYKMKEAMAKMKDKSAMKAKGEDAVGPKGSATIPAHIRKVYPKLTNEAYNKDKSFYDKASQAVIRKEKASAMKQTKPDFPDIDGDGNTKESMKQAAADKKSMAKMKKGEAMKMKKKSMAKQTKKQKEKLPAGLVKEIAKKAGKAGTAVAREGIKAAGSKVAGKKKVKKSIKEGMTESVVDGINIAGGLKKSPMEQGKTRAIDKIKAFGKAITSKYGLMTPENAAIKKAYSKYKREKKKYRQAAATSSK